MRNIGKIATVATIGATAIFAFVEQSERRVPISVPQPSIQHAEPPSNGADAASRKPSVARDPQPGRAQASAAPFAGPISAKLRRELATARDYRSYAYSALGRPEEGGYFYAKFAAGRCLGITQRVSMAQESVGNTVLSGGTISSELLAKLQDIGSKCAGFTSDEEVRTFLKDVQQRETDQLDPLVNANSRVRQAANEKPFDYSTLRNAVAQVVGTGDPLLFVQSHPELLFARDPVAVAASGIRFDGKIYQMAEVEKLKMAIQLSGCEISQPCDLDWTLDSICVSKAVCYEDRREYAKFILKSVYNSSEADYQEMLKIEEKMRSAVSSGNSELFMK